MTKTHHTLPLALLVLLAVLVAPQRAMSQGPVLINEIMAANQSTIYDDFNQFDDWIEFYYPSGSDPVLYDLAGHYLTDSKNNLTKWMFPEDELAITTIVAGQHLLFWVDDDMSQGPDHVGFKLSGDGEKVYLVNPDGVTVMDSVWFGDQAPDVSLGRECDGCEEWVYFNVPTPDDDNEVLPEDPHILLINEVMPGNSDYFDDPFHDFDPWIEIYNPNPFNINLGGYAIEVGGESFTISPADPADTYIQAGGYYLIWCDGQTLQGLNHADLTLDPGGDTVVFKRTDGSVVDSYAYNSVSDSESWGRASDGSATSQTFDLPTPRCSNTLVFITPELLYINEVLADNATDTTDAAGAYPDWVEIYNPNPYDVDLAGYYISDKLENPTKWRVPTEFGGDSTVVEAYGYKLFWADEDGDQGWNHMSFRLKDSGEELGVYSPDGFSEVDEVEWNGITIPEDVTLGRETDGNEPWVWFSATTPEYSNNGMETAVSEHLAQAAQIRAYPNPARDVVRFSEAVSGGVWSLDGQLVHTLTQATLLQVGDWTRGVYYLRTVQGQVVALVIH